NCPGSFLLYFYSSRYIPCHAYRVSKAALCLAEQVQRIAIKPCHITARVAAYPSSDGFAKAVLQQRPSLIRLFYGSAAQEFYAVATISRVVTATLRNLINTQAGQGRQLHLAERLMCAERPALDLLALLPRQKGRSPCSCPIMGKA